MEVSPSRCDEVDDQLWAAGEKWVSDNNPVNPDRLMTAQEISDRHGIEVHNIRAWARRHPDKIKKYNKGGKVLFLLREVLAYRG